MRYNQGNDACVSVSQSTPFLPCGQALAEGLNKGQGYLGKQKGYSGKQVFFRTSVLYSIVYYSTSVDNIISTIAF